MAHMKTKTPVATSSEKKCLPNPLPFRAVTEDEAAVVRRLYCVQYDGCLRRAAIGNWTGFHCGGCSAYAPISPEQAAHDAIGLKVLNELPEHEERVRLNKERAQRRDDRRALIASRHAAMKGAAKAAGFDDEDTDEDFDIEALINELIDDTTSHSF